MTRSAERARALASTKFHAPPSAQQVIDRPRLFELVDAGTRHTLTVVAAPAGTGKTMLVSSWQRSCAYRDRVVWMTLDETDDKFGLFWSGLLEAIRMCPNPPPGLLRSLGPPPMPGPHKDGADFPARLVNAIGRLSEPLLIVMDDFHVITDAGVLAEIDYVLDHAPEQLRLVLCSRVDPPLRLHRLRLAGQLTEIRSSDLAFRADEAEGLLAGHDLSLRADQLAVLVARTEGWAAGLRLAALTLQQTDDPSRVLADLSGEVGVLADYLLSEVLTRLPSQMREFLLRACMVDRICDDLAVALTGNRDSPRLLAGLARGNVFITAAGTRPVWYRWHQLLAELARKELRWEAPQEIPRLHAVAARWFGDRDLPVEALAHAEQAGDWTYAAALVGGSWQRLLAGGELGTVRVLLDRFPEQTVGAEPQLALARAALHIDDGDPVAAEALTDAAERVLGTETISTMTARDRRAIQVTLAVQRLHYERTLGREYGARQEAERLLAELDAAEPGSWMEHAHRARLRIGLGLVGVNDGDIVATEHHMHQAMIAAGDENLRYLRLSAQPWLAVLACRAGNLEGAMQQALEVIDFADRHGWSGSHSLAAAYWALGRVHYFRDELVEARRGLEHASSLVPESEVVTATLIARVRAQVLCALGDVAGARRVLDDANKLGDGWSSPRWLTIMLAVAEADQRISEGELTAARDLLLEPETPDELSEHRARQVVLADVQLRLGAAAQARKVLAPWMMSPPACLVARVEVAALGAATAAQLGDEAAARDSAELALALAAPQQIRRPFLDCPSALAATLASLVELGVPHSDFALDLLERARVTSIPQQAEHHLVEPLSERELEVLRYLRTRLSKAEIASQLFVSENTIRTHVKSIYRKLDASDRQHALTRAHDFKLL